MARGRISRSCAKCRAAKRRCDQRLPHCGQCIRAHEDCPGYRDEWELVFRDQTDHTIKRSKEKRAKRATSAETDHSSPISCGRVEELSFEDFLMLQYFSRPRLWAKSQTSSLPPTISSSTMMRNQVISSYLRDCCPRQIGSTCNIDITQVSRGVISDIFALPQKSVILDNACAALSCIFLGKIYHDEPVLQYGIQLYNYAIAYMSNAISRKAYSNDIVYTCAIFQQLQILSGFMHLSEETIAWLKEPIEDGPLFRWITLFAETSRIASAVSRLDESGADHIAYQSLLDDCLALEKDHLNFYSSFDQNIDGEPPTYAPGEFNGFPSTDELFGPAYCFSSPNDAILHISFWLSLSWVYPLIQHCETHARVDIPDGQSPIEDQSLSLATFYVAKAARGLAYCAQEGMGSWGTTYGLVFAAQSSHVYTHAKDWDRFLWAQDVFIYLEERGCDQAARLREIQWNYWFDPRKNNTYRMVDYRKFQDEDTAPVYRATEGNLSNAATI
ncbi:uncharacterized protein N7459_002041 [Penicillium hispanicum]|uniref:uncharacterized protein n=1 Tax=Penicillium hispanicum TaxID=1080232 RepID=UPI002542228D|nr:uncharacterized protein N7459_002041 [Penicillium hispanicum]KAJ5591672.1 hypothetical protein N7459_002041 [Penicillium hispanicum]